MININEAMAKLTGSISGVGVDLVDLPRIEQSLKEHGDAFIKRIAHEQDLLSAPQSPASKILQFWASRFAVKEAFSKALGTGIGAEVSFKDVGVKNLASGKPELVVSDKVAKHLQTKGIGAMHLSLSHTDTMAIAVVVLEKVIIS